MQRNMEMSQAGTMSRSTYLGAISAVVAVLIMISSVATSTVEKMLHGVQLGTWAMIGIMLGALAVSVVGVMIVHGSDVPAVSFAGGSIVALAMGAMVAPVTMRFTEASVTRAFWLAALIVLVTGAIGAVIKKDLGAWGRYLFIALIAAIIGSFGLPLLSWLTGMPMTGALTLLDWAVIILFSLMTVYDMNIAVRMPHTLDNAIDNASSVFINFMNIFIRLLSLMGNSR